MTPELPIPAISCQSLETPICKDLHTINGIEQDRQGVYPDDLHWQSKLYGKRDLKTKRLNQGSLHAMHGAMQKLQILFPDPLMAMLRQLARVEDRPVSEIVRRAVDRDMEQRAGMLSSARAKKASPPAFPTFDGGAVLVKASDMKALLHADDA